MGADSRCCRDYNVCIFICERANTCPCVNVLALCRYNLDFGHCDDIRVMFSWF